MNSMMLLEMSASGAGERVALTSGGESLSYQALYKAAGGAADLIQQSGQQHLALLDENSMAVPLGLFGSAWAGVPFVPINYRLTEGEVNALLDRIKPCLLVVSPSRINDFASTEGIQVISRDDFIAQSMAREIAEPSWDMDPESTAVLLFTSGTTGSPKAAILRHKHLVSYILSSVEFMSSAEEEAALVSAPPYHIAGISAALSSTYSCRRIVQLPNFDADQWVDLAARERVTHAFVVPTMLARITEALESDARAELPSLQAIAYGGGKMPLTVIRRAMALFPNAGFANAYGLTETSSTISVLTPQDHRDAVASDDAQVSRRLVSAGRLLPGVEVEIRNPEGKVLPAGESGEIYVRGEQVSGEYVGKGSLLDPEGWFPTRDAGSLDSGGYLFLEGRADDVIVRGGENISPGEIEDVLLLHPAVKDAAVVGVPDEQWGEAVGAALVLEPAATLDAQEVTAWVRERLRSSRAPQVVQYWDELPYNETGKLLRRIVRDKMASPV